MARFEVLSLAAGGRIHDNGGMNSRTMLLGFKSQSILPMLVLNTVLAVGTLLLAIGSGSGCAGTATKPSTGEYIDDGVVTARVKAALLRDKVTPGTDIQVETFRGVVQLSGFVNTGVEKTHATEVTRAVPGVQQVVNNITVK
jgi:hyperosmotically inducible periplasmic protein